MIPGFISLNVYGSDGMCMPTLNLQKMRTQFILREHNNLVTLPLKLECEAIQCRMMARKFVLDKQKQPADDKLKKSLEKLTVEINNTSDIEMKEAVSTFQEHVLQQIDNPNVDERRTVILKACNDIR
jgi:hypothetical protein